LLFVLASEYMDIDQQPGSTTWCNKQDSPSTADESDSPTYSTQASPTLGGQNNSRHQPGYIYTMDSGQHRFSGHGISQQRDAEKTELLRENEELHVALAGLREQVSSATHANPQSAPPVALPSTNLMSQVSLNDFILRQQLKKHNIPKFLGTIDHEGVVSWADSVTHFALLAGLNNNATITAAWTAIAPDVLLCFKAILATDYCNGVLALDVSPRHTTTGRS